MSWLDVIKQAERTQVEFDRIMQELKSEREAMKNLVHAMKLELPRHEYRKRKDGKTD